MHTNRDASGAGGEIVSCECSLPSFVQFALLGERQRVGRNDYARFERITPIKTGSWHPAFHFVDLKAARRSLIFAPPSRTRQQFPTDTHVHCPALEKWN